MADDRKIWLTGQGVKIADGDKRFESIYSITFQNIHISVRFMPEFSQAHMIFGRDDLILLRDAIDKEIKGRGED